MKRLTRRNFLTTTAAAVASPAIGAPSAAVDTEVIIIGAGAAGIWAGMGGGAANCLLRISSFSA